MYGRDFEDCWPNFYRGTKTPSQTERTGEGAQIIDLLVNSYSVKVKIKSLGLLLQIETVTGQAGIEAAFQVPMPRFKPRCWQYFKLLLDPGDFHCNPSNKVTYGFLRKPRSSCAFEWYRKRHVQEHSSPWRVPVEKQQQIETYHKMLK